MRFSFLFTGLSKRVFILIAFLGLVNSALISGILLVINHAISKTPLPFPGYHWAIYGALITGMVIVGNFCQSYLIRLSENTLYRIEVSLLEKIRLAVFEDFEKIGEERIYAAISDAKMLAQIPEVLLGVFNACIMLICGLGYLMWTNLIAGLVLFVLMTALLLVYIVRNKGIEEELNSVRDLQNHYYRYLRDLLFGFREIKMSARRNERLFNNYLLENRIQGRDKSIRINIQYLNNELIGSLSWYILLGMVLFAMPQVFHLPDGQTTTFVVVILFLISPVSILIKFFPFFTRSKISVERIEALETDIRAKIVLREQTDNLNKPEERFNQVVFSNVGFEYPQVGKRGSFQVGPLNLNLNSGEIIFITGANGSGKSTFINLLTGLYLPKHGNICWNGRKTGIQNNASYSNRFSAIFTSNYLFEDNYDDYDLKPTNKRLTELINLMQLSDLNLTREDKKSLGVHYSKGQQKRIAMIYTLLEDREFIILDECAAEQDPQFKSHFYLSLLPLLRREGKTVIAVTHDEHYFSCADRIIHFESGTIVSDTSSKKTSKTVIS